MRYRFIAFDVDGTLLNSAYADSLALQQTLREELDMHLSREEIRGLLGLPGEVVLCRLGVPEAQYARITRLWTRRLGEYAALMALFPGVREMLAVLWESGALLGVVTSKNAQEYAQDVPPLGITQYFHAAVTAGETRRGKPEPDPLLECMRRVGAKPEETLYIGDTPYDRDCARGAGADFALATWGSATPDMEGATWYLRRPEDILDILGQ